MVESGLQRGLRQVWTIARKAFGEVLDGGLDLLPRQTEELDGGAVVECAELLRGGVGGKIAAGRFFGWRRFFG